MAKKKKVTPVNKITPKISTTAGVQFDELKVGECFLMNGCLYIKESGNDQIGVDLATGKYHDCLCGTTVIPVDISITWKKK